MRMNGTVYLVDVQTSQDEITGLREKLVLDIKPVLGSVRTVGTNTFWAATSAHVRLDRQVTLKNKAYSNQKYAFFQNKLYEIYNTAPAEDDINIKLNCVERKDAILKEAVEDALGISKGT